MILVIFLHTDLAEAGKNASAIFHAQLWLPHYLPSAQPV